MKYVTFVFLGLISGIFCLAQQTPTDVTLTYSISINAPQNKNMEKAFNGATYTVFLKGGESRTEMHSNLGTESSLYNNKTGQGVILKEYSGQKLMITLTRENWKQKNQLFHSLIFSSGTTVSKIGNFEVKPGEATLDGKPFMVFYSNTSLLPNSDYNNAFGNLKGIPVKYDLKSGNLTFTYTLTSISYEIIPAAKFELPKTGFRVMSYDENQQMKQGSK